MSKRAKIRNNVPRAAESYTRLDELDISMIKELIRTPNLRSAEIATRHHFPLSIVQRRRTHLERSILKKIYQFDFEKFGWRKADLLITVDKGDCEVVARRLLNSFDKVIGTSLRIGDPAVNVMAEVCYESSRDLHGLIEGI